MADKTPTIAFVCVQNAGRSQMATAYAERESKRRQVDVEILTGGTDPAEHVHDIVLEVLQEEGIDRSDVTPREVTDEELERADYVITMGCSVEETCPVNPSGETRDWDLDDPDGQPIESVRSIRDDIKRRVTILFDELDK